MFDSDLQYDFKTFKDWFNNAPERGAEYFPKVSLDSQLYKDWLLQFPNGYSEFEAH